MDLVDFDEKAYMLDFRLHNDIIIETTRISAGENGIELDLSRLSLKEINFPSYGAENIVAINLANNEFDALPRSVLKMVNLKALDIRNNQFDTIPEIAKSFKLEKIGISGNPISSSLDILRELKHLRAIYYDLYYLVNESYEFLEQTNIKNLHSSMPSLINLDQDEIKKYKLVISYLKDKDIRLILEESTLVYKTAIVGDPGTRRNRILAKITEGSPMTGYLTTVGANFGYRSIYRHPIRIKLSLHDIYGRAIDKPYRGFITGCFLVLLVFNVYEPSTLKSLEIYSGNFKNLTNNSILPVILVGNKIEQNSNKSKPDLSSEINNFQKKIEDETGYFPPYIEVTSNNKETKRTLIQTIFNMCMMHWNQIFPEMSIKF